MTRDNWKKEIIQQIKDCGQSLIDNAENIISDYEYTRGFVLTCYVGTEGDAPYISVDTEFYPENFMKRNS